jgi:hypothetical protein
MEAADSAFSGTEFHGAEMVHETLLLSSKGDESPSTSTGPLAAPSNFTLSELTLLCARGLRHETSGPNSALGTIQTSLDDIVASDSLSGPLPPWHLLMSRSAVACVPL